MWTVFFHAFAGALLLGAIIFDALFIRTPATIVIQPEELVAAWRRRIALLQMLSAAIVIGLGLYQWIPNMRTLYPGGIFHAKLLGALVFLALAKVRMLKERKGAVGYRLTKVMAAIVVLVFALGLIANLRLL